MRYAFLSDIHGNIHALSEVKRFLRYQNIHKVIVLGDLVGYGANPGPVLDFVQREGWEVGMGSSDARVAFEFTEKPRQGVADTVLSWTREQLSEEQLNYLRALKTGGRILTSLGRVRYFHGSPGNPDEKLDLMMPEKSLLPLLENLGARVLVCGGTHIPYVRESDEYLVFDPGSVGLTLNREPGADLAILDLAGERPAVKMHKVPYDNHAAAFDIMAWGLPEQIAEVLRQGGSR